METGILQAHWQDLVGINFVRKKYQSIRKGSRVMNIFTNSYILASVLPRSMESAVWRFLCLDLINIDLYTKLYKKFHMVEDLR